MAKIYKDLNKECIQEIEGLRVHGYKIIATSGGFDPLHVGHVRCIQESKKVDCKGIKPKLVIIVNGDGFLERKKGKPFMPHEERMEIIAALEGVDYVVGWDDGSQTVTGAIALLQPHFFTKGGDRDSAQNVPEFEMCERLGCEVVFNVGGSKIQSSSNLIANEVVYLKCTSATARQCLNQQYVVKTTRKSLTEENATRPGFFKGTIVWVSKEEDYSDIYVGQSYLEFDKSCFFEVSYDPKYEWPKPAESDA